MTSSSLDTTAEHLLRDLTPQVLGAVIRRFRDFTAAEDAVQEALLAAALQWPREGVPDNPRAWLIHVASRRMTDPATIWPDAAGRPRPQWCALAALRPWSRSNRGTNSDDADGRLTGHHRLDAVRAHLLELAGDHQSAIAHYRAAASRTASLPERNYLLTQAARLRESAIDDFSC